MSEKLVDAGLTLALVVALLSCVWVTDAFWQMPGLTSVGSLAGMVRAVGVLAA